MFVSHNNRVGDVHVRISTNDMKVKSHVMTLIMEQSIKCKMQKLQCNGQTIFRFQKTVSLKALQNSQRTLCGQLFP